MLGPRFEFPDLLTAMTLLVRTNTDRESGTVNALYALILEDKAVSTRNTGTGSNRTPHWRDPAD